MDIPTIKLIETHTVLPSDIVHYINEFVMYKSLDNKSIYHAVDLWITVKPLCLFTCGHISYWDVSKVTDMEQLFCFKEFFNEDLSRWNTSNVVNMRGMFCNTLYFNSVLSNWDVGNVTNMDSMFYYASQFNYDISTWNIRNAKNMNDIFVKAHLSNTHYFNFK